jgi:hypothetical protein
VSVEWSRDSLCILLDYIACWCAATIQQLFRAVVHPFVVFSFRVIALVYVRHFCYCYCCRNSIDRSASLFSLQLLLSSTCPLLVRMIFFFVCSIDPPFCFRHEEVFTFVHCNFVSSLALRSLPSDRSLFLLSSSSRIRRRSTVVFGYTYVRTIIFF